MSRPQRDPWAFQTPYADALRYGIQKQTSFKGEILHSMIYAPPDKRIVETPNGLAWSKVGRRRRRRRA